MVEKFRCEFFKKNLGAALILSEVNRFYLSGFESSDGAVLITKDEAYLIVDFRYYEAAKATAAGFKVVLADKALTSVASELCNKHGINKVYIEDDYVTIALDKRIRLSFENAEIDYLGDIISRMRVIKTPKEIERIKASQALTDAAFSYILGFLKKGITEKDVANELEYYIKKNGAQELAFKTIAVSGANSSLPHGEPGNRILTENSFLTMDYGAKLDGYCSDMTRTVVIGKADSDMRYIYGIVLDAQANALSKIRADVTGCEVDSAARNIINEAGYEKNFGHSTGHGLGIEVHELPSYSPKYNKTIPENAVLSIEPGIYIEGKYGVRIEDIAVVGKDGPINLTKSDKNLIEL